MYDKTVTVFNKYTDQSQEIYWYPHVLTGVDLIVDKSANIAKTGLDGADTANLHVKYAVIDGKKMVGDKEYLPPKEWAKQANEKLSETITFASGDFFIEGEYSEKMVTDSDYSTRVDSGFYDYMNKNKDNVFLVTNVGVYSMIPHFEIGGK